MARATRLHKRYLGDSVLAFGKRLPEPEPEPGPGLLGDVVDGVATVADNAASSAVGLVTTVVSDVNALVAPPKQTSSAASTRVSGSSVHATTTATTAKPKSKPEPSASSTAVSGEPSEGSSGSGGSSGNSGGESSNGGGSGSSGGNGSSDDSNSGGTPSGSGSGSGAGSGSGPGFSGGTGSVNGDGSSVNSSNFGPDASSINININGGGNPSSTLQQTPGANSNASGSQTSGVGTVATSSASASATGTGTGTGNLDLVDDSVTASGSAASASPIINAVASKDSVSPSDSSLSSSAPRSTATPSGPSHTSSTSGSSSPGSGSGGGVTGNSDGSAANGSGALSPGVIAAIAVACSLVLLALLVLILRKWYRTRRARRFEHWVSRPGAFTFFRAAAVSVNSEKDEKSVGGARSGSGSGLGSGSRSARSSFGTTFDQGLRPFTPDTFFEPSASSFSEFCATANTPTSFLSPSPAAAMPSVQRPENAVDRQSLLSMGSSSPSSSSYGSRNGHGNTSTEAMAEERIDDGGGADAQYLLAPAPQASGSPGRPQLSPISVRPWSPSERWAFPKPPTTTAQSIVYYTPPSPPASHSAHVERVPASPLPPVPSPRAEHDPFADPLHHDTSTGARPASASASASAPSASESASGTDTDTFIGAVDYVRRPFVPTLADELAVLRGDTIRVLQSFDDGWVQIEKLSSAASDSPMAESKVASGLGSGSAKNERGLIPVDCLRETGEALPAFLASRRVSSYYGGVAI